MVGSGSKQRLVGSVSPLANRLVSPPMADWLDIDPDWFKYIKRCGFPFPRDYIVFDLETTGKEELRDYILQIGIVEVVDCKVKASKSVMLDWTSYLTSEQMVQFKERLALREIFAKEWKQPVNKFSIPNLQANGVNPVEVMSIVADMFNEYMRKNVYILAYNGRKFDTKMLRQGSCDVLGAAIDIHDDALIDVGLVEKASQIGIRYPYEKFKMLSFYKEAVNARPDENLNQTWSNIRWKLQKVSEEKYKLDKKHNLDLANAHDAEFDSLVTHYVYQEHYNMAHGITV